MALLIDDDHITLSDLLSVDPEVAEIADAEGITVEGDGGIARQAWDECADRLMAAMRSFSEEGPRVRLSQIVVSSEHGRSISPLRRWMIYRALALFYRAAMNRRVSDRYADKHDRMRDELKSKWRVLSSLGLPFVIQPVPCPGAVHGHSAGQFGAESVSFVPGGSQAEASFDVALTWVNQATESGPSKVLTVTIPENQLLRVSIEGLTPPAGVTGWNVYVGAPGGYLYLQNEAPVSVASEACTLTGAPVLSGTQLGTGQAPDFTAIFQAVLPRA